MNVERLKIGIRWVRRFSICVGESEEELCELVFIRFLVVPKLRGDGGHVLEGRAWGLISLRTPPSEVASVVSLCNSHLSSFCQRAKDHGYKTFRQ